MTLKVGIVGLGIMGGAFAKNLRTDNIPVVGCDLVEKNVQALVEAGGEAATSPKDVADKSDVVITSLPSIAAFHDVMTGANSFKSANKEGLIIVETSTLPLEDKQEANDALAKMGMILLDCPISGTGAQAVTKDLSVYVSGDEDAAKKCVPVFDGFARANFYVGEFGNGSKMKFVANHLVHIHNIASAEAMVLGMKAGLDPATIYDVIRDGAGNSRIFELRGPMMVKDNYEPATMKMDIWKKDMTVIGEFANSLKCPTPLFTAGTDIYRAALANGMDKLDTAAVCKVLEKMAGLERK